MGDRRGGAAVSSESSFDSSTIALLLCGCAAPLVFLPFVFWSGLVTPGYSHFSSTFSDAAAQGQPYPAIIGTGLVLLGLLLGLYGLGLSRTLPRYGGLCRASLTVAALAIAGTGIFQDHNRSPFVERNLEGMTHNAFAMVAILGIIATIAVTVLAVRDSPEWERLPIVGVACLLGTAVTGIAFLNVGDGRDGLAERLFAAVAIGWLVLMAVNGLRIAAEQGGLESRRHLVFDILRSESVYSTVPVGESETRRDG